MSKPSASNCRNATVKTDTILPSSGFSQIGKVLSFAFALVSVPRKQILPHLTFRHDPFDQITFTEDHYILEYTHILIPTNII